jgi:aminocarboxymuconate-semialdehyde decarboxylase
MLEVVVDLVGPNRITLGTDYPFPLGEDNPGELIKLSNYSDDFKAMMLGTSALEWLNMPLGHFKP